MARHVAAHAARRYGTTLTERALFVGNIRWPVGFGVAQQHQSHGGSIEFMASKVQSMAGNAGDTEGTGVQG
jgi:hypothetical protein